MKTSLKTALIFITALPFAVSAHQWTAEQQEVIEFEIACWTAGTAEEYAACFNEDYEGWVLRAPVPMNKADRVALAGNAFNDNLEITLFKPMSIIIKSNVAVVNYIIYFEDKNALSGEVESFIQRWIDVAVKEDGKWSWLSDYGNNVHTD